MADVTLSIDGQNISCPAGSNILEAAELNGIKIPRLCHHPDLKPYGACRLCLVEDVKSGRIMASCVTPVGQDMVVMTESPRVIKHRKNIVRLMIAEHPESCIVCSKGNRCRLRLAAAELGVGETGLYPMPNYQGFEQANPFIIRDLSKCILCGKCIRADHELVVVGAIDYNTRGFESRPTTLHELALEHSSCTFCGTCVSMCPTGALSVKNTFYVGTPEEESPSVCGFCGVGCSLMLGTAFGRVMEVNPSEDRDSVNGATLCVRGHFAHDFLNSDRRLTVPQIRKEDELVEASWDEALELAAVRLTAIAKENGPQSVAFLGSSKCSNEENYLFQKIARAILKTNNVDNGSYISGRTSLKVLEERTGGGYRLRPLAGLEEAEAVLVLGANPHDSMPVASYYLKRASRLGIPLVVVDPRRTDLVDFSSAWLAPFPGTDAALINGLAQLLIGKNAYDAAAIDQFTKGFSRYQADLARLNLDDIYRATGIESDALETAAEILNGKKIAFVIGQGILKQAGGVNALDAAVNLALLTGSFGHQGAGFFVLAKENNQVGAWDMGSVPESLPGRQSIDQKSVRQEWERAWQVDISPDKGLDMVRMIEEVEKGNLKALYCMGENPVRNLPQSERVEKALRNLDFLVVQDVVDNETSRLADVLLPGAAFSEKAGSFTNTEDRIQLFSPAVPPPGEAKPDWEILSILAEKMGSPVKYDSLKKVRAEISRLVPMYADLDTGENMGWVRILGGKKLFNPKGQGEAMAFSPLESMDKIESMGEIPADDAYPLTAILGSVRFHLGGGTRTALSDRIREFASTGDVEMSRQNGRELDLKDGNKVKIISPHGQVERNVKLVDSLAPGQLFMPEAVNSNDAGNLIDLVPLDGTESTGWKTCRVRLEKISVKP